MNEADFLFQLPTFEHRELSGVETGKPRKLKTKLKQDRINAMRQETADRFLDHLPAPDEQIHILSNGKFDYWGLITRGMALTPGNIVSLFVSTWTMNLPIARELVQLVKTGKVQSVTCWLNNYLKSREPHVWAYLQEHLGALNQKVFATENHAKIAAWKNDRGGYFVISGSANLTANPRIEQNFIAQSKELHDFYVSAYKAIEPK